MTQVRDPIPAADREATSLDGLYRRYAGWLKRRLRQQFGAVDQAAAEDLVQETYIRVALYQARGEVRYPRAFLLRVASNLARNHMRQTYRGGQAPVSIEEIGERAEYDLSVEQDQTLRLAQLVDSLPENVKDVFVLSRYAGLTNQAIAEELDIALSTVEGRITRALSHLAARLAEGA